MKKILIMSDLYRGGVAWNTNMLYLTISPLFVDTTIQIECLISDVNRITDKTDWRDNWIKTLTGEQTTSILSKFDLSDTYIIGFALNDIDKKHCDTFNVRYIDIEIHPIRFLSDLALIVKTSFQYPIENFAISKSRIQLEANAFIAKYSAPTDKRKLLIIGQTEWDKAIFENGQKKTLLDYVDRLIEIASVYDEVYFKPHPLECTDSIASFIVNKFSAQIIEDKDIYELLPKMQGVVGISSSVLSEAEYFGINSYFLKEKYEYGVPVDYIKFMTNQNFWREFLQLDNSVNLEIIDYLPRNFLRNIWGGWSFVPIDEKRMIETITSQKSQLLELKKNVYLGYNPDSKFIMKDELTDNMVISYAQNFEDVILWRALKHVKNGFYIDVGANYPNDGSVTKLFYEKGWNGINIEPNIELFRLLEENRQRDINLNVAISESSEPIDFYIGKDLGWSTTDKNASKNLIDENNISEIRKVSTMLLDDVCDLHAQKDIHFLKIDVEGAELSVLKTISLKKIRPWVLIVEATQPRTQIDVSKEWEFLLIDNEYMFAYFDGLNKFYIAKEHCNLISSLNIPPNIFDNFILYSQYKAEQHANEANARATQAEQHANEANARATQAEQHANEANARATQAEQHANEANARATQAEQHANEANARATQAEQHANEANARATQAEQHANEANARATQAEQYIELLLNSNSWKITKPLRKSGILFKKLIGKMK